MGIIANKYYTSTPPFVINKKIKQIDKKKRCKKILWENNSEWYR